MKSLTVLFACLVMFTGCKRIDGTAQVLQSFTYVNPASDGMIDFCKRHPTDYYCKGIDTENRTTNFPVGQFSANSEFPSEEKIFLQIQLPEKLSRLSFSIPRGSRAPIDGGPFSYPASELGVPYDLAGHVDVRRLDSAVYKGYERCTYTEREWVCRQGYGRRRRCFWEIRQLPAQRWVEYFDRVTERTFDANLYNRSTSDALVRFTGAGSEAERVYLHTSDCRP